MPGHQEEDIFYFYQQIKQQKSQTYYFINDWDLYYLGHPFSKYTVILGPFLTLTPDIFSLIREYNLSSHQREDLKVFLNQIQVLNSETYLSYASVLQLFDHLTESNNDLVQIRRTKENNSHTISRDDKHHDENSESIINLRYKIEAEILHVVKQGNKEKGFALLKENNILFSFSERFPNQPLLRVKNFFIIFNTLLRSAARDSRVPAIFIHRLSEKYALQIENITRLSDFSILYERMMNEYCDLIIENSLSKYSTTIQKAIEHIMINYDKKIDTAELAAQNLVHPNHLARKFKHETGNTMIAYQRNIRINQAQHLLKEKNLPIDEIAWIVGYEDSSYFTRVFKKYTGLTPTEYRDS